MVDAATTTPADTSDITHIRDLIEDPENRREHNPRNIGMIATALQEVGAARSIVIDENNVVRAGNGVLEAAAEVGITKVKVVEADGNTIVAVRRRGLDDEQKRRLAMFDNRTNEVSSWSREQLQLDVDNGLDMSPFFTDKEIENLLGSGDAENKTVVPMQIGRPTEVVWVLLAVPIEEWPKHLASIETMQLTARFSATVVRPNETAGPKATTNENGED